jgi:phosphoglycerate dehydrogenase-like enzyme
MPDISLAPLVIAHQLPVEFATRIGAALPPSVGWRALNPQAAWEVPEDAQILLAVPGRGGNIATPAQPPAGWPRNLKWIQAVSAGIDEYPPWIFDVKLVTCGRGTNSAPISEFVLAALLANVKRLPEIWISDAAGWKITELGTLAGQTLGLVGYGSIGQAIAARALPFGMEIVATARTKNSGSGENGVRFAPLDDVLAASDHLVIALPLTAATAGLIGRAAFARVKRGVHLVNISRGRIIDHDALLEALDSGRVGAATLDVTEPEPLPTGHPLYTHPSAKISPHLSWSDGERGRSSAAFFAANLQRFIAGETLEGLVNPQAGY